jgi:hypothetical protein
VSQRSYLVKQSVDFGQTAKFLIRPGDILTFDSQNQNKVTVYRNGEIQKILPNQSLGGLTGLAKSGWITEIHPNDAPRAPRTAARPNGKPLQTTSRASSGQTAPSAAQSPKTSKKLVPDATV